MSFENPTEFTPEHISESSPEYQENREEVHNRSTFSAFGEFQLTRIDKLRKDLNDQETRVFIKKKIKVSTEKEDTEVIDIQKKIDNHFNSLRRNLKNILQSPTRNTSLFLREVLRMPEIAEKVKRDEDLPPQTSEYTEESRLGTFILKDKLEDSDLEKIVRRHLDLYFKKVEKFNEVVPEIFARFRDSALEAIKQKYLPITEELLESRIGVTRVALGDNLLMEDHHLARHNVALDKIEISQKHRTVEEVEESIFHELVHAISGRTIIMNNEKDDIVQDIEHQRMGLVFNKVNSEGAYIGKQFGWLNEAITEDIAAYLVKRETRAYKKERSKLKELYEKGLSRDVLYKAYFENYEPTLKDKVPAWKEFTKEINTIYPDTGIQELIKTEDNL